MKTNLFFFVCWILISFSVMSQDNGKKILSIRADEWCPFNCDPKGQLPGYMVEVVKEILEPKGYQIDYQIWNWARAIHDAKLGKIDAIIGAGKEDAEGFFLPKEPQGLTQYSLFGLKESKWRYENEKSLDGVKLGMISNYSYDEGSNDLQKKKHPSLEFVSSEQPLLQLIRLLQSKRIVAFVESNYVLDYFVKTRDIKVKLKNLGQIKPNSQELFLAISPKYPAGKELSEIISEGTEYLRKTGKLQRILKKYGLKDWRSK